MKADGLPIMDVKNGSPRLMRRMRSDLSAALSDPERMNHMRMTGSLSYESAKLRKSDRVNMIIAAAVHNRLLATTVSQNT